MEERDVIEVLDLLEAAGVDAVLDGGWGIDALLGAQTRPHGDLDLAIATESVDAARAALEERGFVHDDEARPGSPARIVMRDAAGRAVDLHPVQLDEDGNGWQDLGGGAWGLYTTAGLSGNGVVGGRSVRCISPELQLRHHLGWPWSEHDRADMERLAARFGVQLPPE